MLKQSFFTNTEFETADGDDYIEGSCKNTRSGHNGAGKAEMKIQRMNYIDQNGQSRFIPGALALPVFVGL